MGNRCRSLPRSSSWSPRAAGEPRRRRRAAAPSWPTVRAAGKPYLGASCTSWRAGLGQGYCVRPTPSQGIQMESSGPRLPSLKLKTKQTKISLIMPRKCTWQTPGADWPASALLTDSCSGQDPACRLGQRSLLGTLPRGCPSARDQVLPPVTEVAFQTSGVCWKSTKRFAFLGSLGGECPNTLGAHSSAGTGCGHSETLAVSTAWGTSVPASCFVNLLDQKAGPLSSALRS